MEFKNSKSSLGGEILDLNLNENINSKDINLIKNFVDERLVVLIRNQEIDDYKLKEFSSLFGDLDPPAPNPYGVNFLPEHPEINVISNVKNDDGIPIGNLGDGEATWHADMTYLDTPPKYGILYALEVPPNQGNTHFANMYQAYEKLPIHLKKEIEAFVADRLLEAIWRESLWLIKDGICTTKELDDIVRYGFGLRYAQMGVFQTYRTAAGEGGMRQFLEHFGPCLTWPWTKLMDVPEFNDELIDLITNQSDQQANGLSVTKLEQIRDKNLVEIQKALEKNNYGAGRLIKKARVKKSH